MKGQSYIILALIFALIVAIFAVINVEPVRVDYLFGTGQAPLILVILISALMGGLIVGAFGIFRLLKLQREVHNLKREKSSSVQLSEKANAENEDEISISDTNSEEQSKE